MRTVGVVLKSQAPNLEFVAMLVAAVCAAVFLTGADWRQFRGNASNGLAPGEGPTSFDNLAWKAELPGRGVSGPIVTGDRVFVTASSGYRQDRLHVLCFDDATGEKLWERQFWATGRTQTHPKICVAAPNPASDGERVFASFSSNDLACLDLDGNLLWVPGGRLRPPECEQQPGHGVVAARRGRHAPRAGRERR